MTASAGSKPALPSMDASQVNYAFGLDADRAGGQQRMFKKHKVLPHPRRETLGLRDVPRSVPRKYDLEIDTRLSQSAGSQDSSPSLRQRAKKLGGGPEPPPTPPAHSRKSSSTQSVSHSSPTQSGTPLTSTESIQQRPPTTPTNQQTPPTPNLTPDRTPPGPASRYARSRPVVNDRIPSKITIDSRTESFKTAPENPCSSSDDDGTLRPRLSSAKTSQSTVRQVNGEGKTKPQPVGLGLGLESNPGEDLTPRTAKEFNTFDGEWGPGGGGSGSEVEEEWDYNLGRNVTVRKRRPTTRMNSHRDEVVEEATVTPTLATKALRSMSLQESPVVYPSPRRVFSDNVQTQPAPSNSASSINTDFKRSSMVSTRSTASTVVEAILVEKAAPQRRKTLRHMRKQTTLRDSVADLSPSSSGPTWTSPSGSAAVNNTRPSRRRSNPKLREVPRESYVSTSTSNSISSRKARREVWKNGGIPVVIVPDRQSSVKSSSREPSLRSTSSRRSKRSPSLSSPTLEQLSKSKNHTENAEKPRRNRTVSETDGSHPGDQRTIDYPPVVPRRSSSLSAPTSRNGSRTASLTADSLKAQSALHAQQAHEALLRASQALDKRKEQNHHQQNGATHGYKQAPEVPSKVLLEAQDIHQPEVRVQRAPSIESSRSNEPHYFQPGHDTQGQHASHEDHEGHRNRLSVDRYGDPFFGKRLSVQNTPFSQASMDTTGTSNAEVSEAMAVNIYPHQNKSLMVVDHSTKPSESSSLDRYRTSGSETPTIRTSDADAGGLPVTPPQTFSMDDVDSPLRNPRAPPEPPAEPPLINFIPATPSGMTPMVEKEKMLGNYYEMTQEKPARPVSLLKRTLTRNRPSEYGPSPIRPTGFLTRTLSLTRSITRGVGGRDMDAAKRPPLRRHSTTDDGPRDVNRLHPHWRPAHLRDDYSDSEESDWDDEEGPDGRTYRYPPVDNRPRAPLRSLTQRVKRTFAILPVRDSDDDSCHMPDRRTIRRTPSGNLRVMKFRRSLESLPRIELNDGRPYTAPGQSGGAAAAGVNGGRTAAATAAAALKFWRLSNVPSWMGPTTTTTRTLPPPLANGNAIINENKQAGFLPTLGNRMNIVRRVSERRREKRSEELRRMISGPREVRDGVGDVIRRNSYIR
ncbi:hypothetical protein B0H66DRAFT_133949 [Apodospora peruviana]|uniref:Uncharacterized protein n=1 Tax=Apodospora peruviana TaxID=516989 RepID=A0AAE0II47_9PEZI|nr:hypothetical protein B0H66DRAFT_133949 [Apodospora peruviana]